MAIMIGLCVVAIIISSMAMGALGNQIRRENRRWHDIKRRHPKW